MNAAEIIAMARIPLNDRRVPYRHQDADMLRYLQTSVDTLRRVRPDLFIGRFLEATQIVLVPAATDLAWIPATYLQQIADGVSARCALIDNDLAGDGGKSAELFQIATIR